MAFFETVKITGNAGATLDGTAGSPSTGVITVQGVASGTAVAVSGTVSINSIPAGSNLIGQVEISDGTNVLGTSSHPVQVSLANTGSNSTAVSVSVSGTPSVSISGTPTVNQGTSPWVTSDTNLVAQGSTTSGQIGPLVQGAVTTSAPSYTTAKTSPLSLDTSGNLRTSVSGTVTANAGTGTFNIQTNASVNLNQVAGNAVATIANGVLKVGIVGIDDSALDATLAAGSAPANGIAVIGQYNTTQLAPTNGQTAAINIDQAANLLTFSGTALKTLSAQGTSLNSTQTIFSLSGCEAVMVQLTQTTTLTAGAVTFEVSYDGSNWSALPSQCVVDPTSSTFAQISLPYTVQASTNKQFLILMNGAQALRIRTSTAITGTGTVTPNYGLLNYGPLEQVSIIGTPSVSISGTPSVSISGTPSVAQSGTWTVQPGNTPNTTPWLVQDVAGTSNGMSFFTGSVTSTKTQVKGSGGTIYGITCVNNGTAIAYLQVFNKTSSSVTVGTTAPDYVVPIPAPASGSNGAGIREEYAKGLSFGTGITVACTTTRTGSTSATADVNVNYL